MLEPFGRRHLWNVGKDFAHSIGHGVSHCGPVHEYPHYAFARSEKYAAPLAEGMVITNEPGFYQAGEYGIRIENIMCVIRTPFDGFLGFESMTLLPYCKELI